MMTVLKWIFYLVAAVAIIIVGGSFLLPAQAVVTRSTEIAAPPDKVFAIVSDMRRFNEFSPWAELDPNIKYTFEGPESGVGQKMIWTSDNAECRQRQPDHHRIRSAELCWQRARFRHAGKSVASLGPRPLDHRHERHMGLSSPISTASRQNGSA